MSDDVQRWRDPKAAVSHAAASLENRGAGHCHQAPPVFAPRGAASDFVPPAAVARAKEMYRFLERRDSLLGSEAFGDIAWNIMLDLFMTGAAGTRLSVSAVCVGARAPVTTALRYIAVLKDAGLVERTLDREDGRRTYVGLSGRGWACMLELFG